jgi:hypothetical protein
MTLCILLFPTFSNQRADQNRWFVGGGIHVVGLLAVFLEEQNCKSFNPNRRCGVLLEAYQGGYFIGFGVKR